MNADSSRQVGQERNMGERSGGVQGVKGIKERIYEESYFLLNFNSFFPLVKIRHVQELLFSLKQEFETI